MVELLVVVLEGPDVIGVVNLKDILKENIGHRLSQPENLVLSLL